MAIETIERLLQKHRAQLEQGRKLVELAQRGELPPPERVREEQQGRLADLRQRLERTRAARDQMTARYDGEIKRLEEAIARVEQEGKRIDEVLGGRGGVRPPRKPAAAAGKKAPGKAAASKKAAKPRAKKAGKG